MIASLAFCVAACCSCRKGKSGGKPLTETVWSMVEWEGRPFKADNNYTLVLSKEENRFGGRGVCNSIMGNYTVSDDGKLKLNSVASTRAMCPDQAQEDKYVKQLETIDSYRIDGDLLLLFSNGEQLMVMEAVEPAR